MSEYISKRKIDTNVRIYICDQYIRIFKYIRHTLTCNQMKWPERKDEEYDPIPMMTNQTTTNVMLQSIGAFHIRLLSL